MRYVPAVCLREGMIVGKKLYGPNGRVLISENTKLKQSYIDKIIKIGFSGVYISDDISSDIEISSVIDENLRIKAIQTIKKLHVQSISTEKIPNKHLYDSKYLIENIVDDILNNNNILVNMIDIKVFDDYTYFHSVNVAVLSIVLGVSLGLSKSELYKLGLGALFHDIGKVFIKKEILNKKGRLTKTEFAEIKKHSFYGYEYLKRNLNIPTTSYLAALQHHEKFDGTGYPDNKKGSKISLFGRIVAISDVYDALTSERPYRNPMLPSEAIEYIMANGDIMFDSELVKIFVTKIAPYPIGMCVELSNGMKGIVYENYEDAIIRPKIKVIDKSNGYSSFIVDLRDDRNYTNVTIVDIVDI